MKKIVLFFCLIFVTKICFAENLVLENQTPYPAKNQNSKIAIQWASSAKEVQEANLALMNGLTQNPSTIVLLTKSGKINLSIPNSAEYFRVLVWSQEEGEPDLHTNWVDIVPNKTYKLETDHLVPSVLMPGSGC